MSSVKKKKDVIFDRLKNMYFWPQLFKRWMTLSSWWAPDRINNYPVDSAIGFPNIYPLDSDLSGG